MTPKTLRLLGAGVGLLFGLFVSASCGQVSRCTPTTCLGCCDVRGMCQGGTLPTACGQRGATCQNCGLGQCGFGGVCTGVGNTGGGLALPLGGGSPFGGGSAEGGGFAGGFGGGTVASSCSPLNCAGCCFGNRCEPGSSAGACGQNGNSCIACSASQRCASGACVAGSGGGAPATCNTCLATSGGVLTCVPAGVNNNVATCGRNGNMCQNCAAAGFNTCVNGVCGSSGAGGGGAPVATLDAGKGCLQLGVVPWNGPSSGPGGEYVVIPNDGGTAVAGINYTGTVMTVGGASGQSAVMTFEALLINRSPRIAPSLPLSGTFQSIPAGATVEPRSFAGFGCDSMGVMCNLDFVAVRGPYSVTAATPSPLSGSFAGAFGPVRYEQIAVLPDGRFALVPDGGCIELAGFNFNVSW